MRAMRWAWGILAAASVATAQPPAPTAPTPLREPRVTVLRTEAGHAALSPDGGTLAWEAPGGKDGYTDIYTGAPEPGAEGKCITCGHYALPGAHSGRPAWHPKGRYLAFQAQKKGVPTELDPRCTPGRGQLNDVYLFDTETNAVWQMVKLPLILSRDLPGVLAPRFSPDGRFLVWAQRTANAGPRQGTWELRLGDFEIGREGPTLRNIRKLPVDAPTGFFEPGSFSADASTLFFAAAPGRAMEVSSIPFPAGGRPTALTDNPQSWDAFPSASPDGRHIVFASSLHRLHQPDPFRVETEFWLMRANGSGKRPLTDLRADASRLFPPAAQARIASEATWSPDGRWFIGLVKTNVPGSAEADRGTLVRVDIPEGWLR